MSPLHSRGSRTKGNKIKAGCLNPAFLEAQQRAGNATSPLHSWGVPNATRVGAKTEKVPNKAEQNQKWLPHPCLLGGHKRAEMLCLPCILGDLQQRGTKSEVANSPLPSRGHKRGRKCYVTRVFSGVPNAKSGEQKQKWSPTKESKIRRTCLTPKRGRKRYVFPAFSGIPNKGEQNQKWLPHPCLLGGPKDGGNATSTLHSRGSPTKGNKIRSGFLTLRSRGPKSLGHANYPPPPGLQGAILAH